MTTQLWIYSSLITIHARVRPTAALILIYKTDLHRANIDAVAFSPLESIVKETVCKVRSVGQYKNLFVRSLDLWGTDMGYGSEAVAGHSGRSPRTNTGNPFYFRLSLKRPLNRISLSLYRRGP